MIIVILEELITITVVTITMVTCRWNNMEKKNFTWLRNWAGKHA